jgi:hypothetical protein
VPAADVLPRSALLAAWGTAALRDELDATRALRAVQGDDEPHDVLLVDDPLLRPCDDLPSLLEALRAAGCTGLRLVLPVPGDVTGLAGPPQVNAEAVEAGECLLTVGGAPLALVPLVEEFGSVHDTGHLVTWWVHDATRPPLAVAGIHESERELREALVAATRQIDQLQLGDSGLSRRGPELLDRLTDVRHGRGPSAVLPPGLPARSLHTVDLAWRVRAIVELATEDDGGAVSGWEATRRDQSLQGLDAVGRRALVTALNAALDVPAATPRPQRWTAS